MPALHVVRVFIGEGGAGGNLVGIFLDGAAVPRGARLAVAAALGYSETVFVDDEPAGAVRIFTPGAELPFAGHPLVGTAWLLDRAGSPVVSLRPPAGPVPTWRDGDLTWIRGRARWGPAMAFEQLGSPAAIDALAGAPPGVPVYYAWAWEDELAGLVRSRMFGPGLGIVEDEATGSAAVQLGAKLARRLSIRQGVGSRLLAVPGPDDTVDVGGRCALVEQRAFDLPAG
jgi:predicted PhzF superfamily epimerase YddE/YHI9